MQVYNIVIGCDQTYYEQWADPLLKSIKKHNPFFILHCHVVNPHNLEKLPFVNYTTEFVNITDKDAWISYLQSVRFLCVAKLPKDQFAITLDADTICTRSVTNDELESLFSKQSILQHPKDNRWLAGLVAFRNDDFRLDYASLLNEKPITDWEWGRDQKILSSLAIKYNFFPADKSWMSIGKNRNESIFLTLKGDQKHTEKYLNAYRKYIND